MSIKDFTFFRNKSNNTFRDILQNAAGIKLLKRNNVLHSNYSKIRRTFHILPTLVVIMIILNLIGIISVLIEP